ncbi:LLM class flavin-dependent oxidoreductase [Burkholderia anthina]|uniref:LLM class flavin-dependent oxidoreductase n=1 Tax=Burkholderia anthina TaxID=179879 RepID=UPI00158EC677|nr:LLM class flavin-dependent oxidoreductase [Burkholderia anthina]
MTRPFRLGVLTRVYAPDPSPRVLHDTLALIEAADALGFDSAWVAQHHFGSETGRLPSPLVLLAAAARRTRRITLGTGVIVLPLESVLRVAEDAAVLDVLAEGRLQLGVGAGFEADVFAAFGRDFGARAALQADALAALRRALDGTPLGPAGATLQPPAPTLAARLWQATGDAEAVARNGHGLIVARTRPEQDGEAALVARYRRAWAHSGAAPRVALVRAVVPGADAASVEASIGPDILRYAARLTAASGVQAPAPADLPALLDRFGVLRGTTTDIAAALQIDPALADATELVVQVQTAGTSHRDALRRLEAVAGEIAPALGWTPAAAGTEAATLTSDPIPT